MARLIVEEGGNTRRFRLGEGKLTLGSGESCMLKLSSSDIAAEHAEIVSDGTQATLRLMPGVRPARVRGREVESEVRLEDGVPVKIGGVTLTVEYERAEAPAASAPRSVVERRPRARQKGAPTWLVYSLIGVGLLAAFFIGRKMLAGDGREDFNAIGSMSYIKRHLDEGNFSAVEAELEKVERNKSSVPVAMLREFEAIRSEMSVHSEASSLVNENQFGNDFLQTQILDFEKRYVRKGDTLQKPYVRVLLKRCAYFRASWPRHPDLEEVKKKEARYADVVKLSDPPSFEDVEVEVKTLTWAKPREYRQCFQVLQAFLDSAGVDDKAKCVELIDEKRKEQAEHFTDRMQQAKYEWQRGEEGKSVGELVNIIIRFDDEAMENQAANEFVRLPGIQGWLEGYKRDQPNHWKLLLENDIVSRKAKELGLV